MKKMYKPKVRNDELSYLSTQVVFEYLRLQLGEQVECLVFPSVQTGKVGTNVVLFPEACVISSRRFISTSELEQAKGPGPRAKPDPLREDKKLAFIEDSLRYHKVTAIETKANETNRIDDVFMSDLVRERLGQPSR